MYIQGECGRSLFDIERLKFESVLALSIVVGK